MYLYLLVLGFFWAVVYSPASQPLGEKQQVVGGMESDVSESVVSNMQDSELLLRNVQWVLELCVERRLIEIENKGGDDDNHSLSVMAPSFTCSVMCLHQRAIRPNVFSVQVPSRTGTSYQSDSTVDNGVEAIVNPSKVVVADIKRVPNRLHTELFVTDGIW
nr:hypothetical protein [Tanacetum cinerariifolium]